MDRADNPDGEVGPAVERRGISSCLLSYDYLRSREICRFNTFVVELTIGRNRTTSAD